MNDDLSFNSFDPSEALDSARDSGLHVPSLVSRRQLLSMMGVTGAVALTPFDAISAKTKKPAKKKAPAKSPKAQNGKNVPQSDGPRVLVVIELQGGNDGFSMLIPSGDSRFRSLRDRAWFNQKDMVKYGDDRYSLAVGLAPLAARLSFVEGVGVAKPDLSHTAMMTRWWNGDPDGNGSDRTGYLGRLCDVLGESSANPVTGVGLGGGITPSLISARPTTVALPSLWSLRDLVKDQDARMRPTLQALAEGGASTAGLETGSGDLLASARTGIATGLSLISSLSGLEGKPTGYPENQLSGGLALARELISLNLGVRVMHVKWGAFDTHTGHAWSHPEQMRQLGASLTAFHNDLARHGLSNRVMVATVSEFGRRPQANAGGTDHGTASTMLLMGPQKPGRHGVAPDFGRLDGAGNVTANVSMADYYASLSSWLGVPPGAVMKSGTPIASLGI